MLSAIVAMSLQTPLPTPAQLDWHRLEYYAFVHFGPNTFSGKEWGEGKEDPKSFSPDKLDCRQWARVFKEAGMKGVIITAKHHDGFCLWPSKFSTHTVAQSHWRGGKGDVLKDLSAACKEYGLKFGVYLSPWDRNHPTYGTQEYNQTFVSMLNEVLGSYGPTFEVWFDGANGEGPNGKRQVYDWDAFVSAVRAKEPKAVIFSDAGPDIRWVGNESGFAGDPLWATINRNRYVPGTPHYRELTNGDPNGANWVPAECDVSIRPGWFWRKSEDSKVKTPEQLMDIYLKSVGRGANLLLNVPANSDGLIGEEDVQALMGFKKLRDQALGRRLSSRWDPRSGVLSLLGPRKPRALILGEDLRHGQRVRKFSVEQRVHGVWTKRFEAESIGHKRILTLDGAECDAFRILILAAHGEPRLRAPSVF